MGSSEPEGRNVGGKNGKPSAFFCRMNDYRRQRSKLLDESEFFTPFWESSAKLLCASFTVMLNGDVILTNAAHSDDSLCTWAGITEVQTRDHSRAALFSIAPVFR